MNDEEVKKFKENFYKPSTSRDPNAAFIVTVFKGVKNAKDSKPEKEEEPDNKKDK